MSGSLDINEGLQSFLLKYIIFFRLNFEDVTDGWKTGNIYTACLNQLSIK